MPEDKDFKRLVRVRMDATGERYTAARSRLRPDAAGPPTPGEPPAIDGVVPMGLDELQEWRCARPWPVPGVGPPGAFGSLWELRVDAGGRLAVLEPPALDVGAVAAVGPATGGVSFITFGLHLELPAPEGCEPGSGPPDPGETSAALRRFHGLLLGHLGLPESVGPEGARFGVARGNGGQMVVPARTATTLLLGAAGGGTVAVPSSPFRANPGRAVPAALLGRLDLSAWPELPGEPWCSYRVVLRLERDLPVQRVPIHPPEGFTGPWHVVPAVGELWDEVGWLLQTAAARSGLPAWPLHEGSLMDATSGWSGVGRNWQASGECPHMPPAP